MNDPRIQPRPGAQAILPALLALVFWLGMAADRCFPLGSSTTSLARTSTTTSSTTSTSTTSVIRTTTTTSTTTSSTAVPPTLVLPYRSYFTQLSNRPSRRIGFALTNQSSLPATVRLTAFDNTGKPLKSSGGTFTNPVIVPLSPGGQWARVAFESSVFGTGLGNASGWFLAESDRAGISGFYLLFNDGLTLMDGTEVSDRLAGTLIFPEVRNAEIALLNPGAAAATATLTLWSDRGAAVGKSASVSLVPGGRYAGPLTGLFAAADIAAAGWLRVSSDQPLAGSELIGTAESFLLALNPIDPAEGSQVAYSAQYAAGGGTYKTTLTLINLQNVATRVEISLVGDGGTALGKTAAVELPAQGRAVLADSSILGVDPAGALVQGYVKMVSSTAKIAGYVRFGDTKDAQFQTALPFARQGQSRLLYAQVVQDPLFFTGTAMVNPNPDAADLFLSVYDVGGARIGSATARIPANGRISRLLSEWIPGLPNMSQGYFKVWSSRPLLGFGVFGTRSLSVLAAVPPQ